MMDKHPASRAEQLYKHPELPSMYVVFGAVIAFAGLLFNCIKGNDILLVLGMLLAYTVIVLCFTGYFAYKCYKNKHNLYTIYTQTQKWGNTQSALRQNAEAELEFLNSQIEALIEICTEVTKQQQKER